MKKLNRVLSLLLAVAMVLGMMTMGTGAGALSVDEFTDAEQIVNVDEVAITSGMGIFAGIGGKFMPQGTVNRAQMATIIVKILRGNEFNADAFKGVKTFSDTIAFEGGWAEGYINACVQMGIVAGYGDGTFKPGKSVTTAEAVTMFINALKVDAGEGEWPTTVMAKAEEMKLYGDLSVKPGTHDALTRDQLAVLTYEAICYSPKGVSGYKVPGVDLLFADIADAMKANGGVNGITEVVGEDSLANQVYTLKIEEGYITKNQATGEDTTTICPVKKDGTLGAGVEYNVQTGLDKIGHYVTIYFKEAYKNEKEPGQVYTIVDDTTVVTVDKAIKTAKDYKAAFGREYQPLQVNRVDKVKLFSGNYRYRSVGSIPSVGGVTYSAGVTAPVGTYIIDDGVIVAYMDPVTAYISKVSAINKLEGKESITINMATSSINPQGGAALSNTEGADEVVEYEGIAQGDYVTYVKAQDMYVLSKVEIVSGTVTKVAKDEDNVDVITMGDKSYAALTGTYVVNHSDLKSAVSASSFDFASGYELYVTADGKYVGYEKSQSQVDLENTVFLLGKLTSLDNDGYGGKVRKTYARGVGMDGKEALVLLAVEYDPEGDGTYDASKTLGDYSVAVTANSFYIVKDSTDREEKEEGIKVLDRKIRTAYDEKTNPVYMATFTSQDNTFSGTATIGKFYAYKKAATHYITLSGSAGQSYPLTATLSVGSCSVYMPAGTKAYALLSQDASGTVFQEVVVFPQEDESAQNELIYVATDKRDSVANNSEGVVYEVYDAVKGTLKEITMKSGSTLPTAGFYRVTKGEDGLYIFNWYDDLGQGVRLPEMAVNMDNGVAVNADHVREGGFGYDLVWHDLHSNRLSSEDRVLKDCLVTGAAVVDVRSEQDIENAGLGEMTSLDQINGLREADQNLSVVFDCYYQESGAKVTAIYITNVTPGTPGTSTDENDVFLYSRGFSATEYLTATNVKETTLKKDLTLMAVYGKDLEGGENVVIPAGTKVAFENAATSQDTARLNSVSAPQIYEYYTVNGELVLRVAKVNHGGYTGDSRTRPNTVGRHNLLVDFDERNSTVFTSEGHARTGDYYMSYSCVDGGPCYGYADNSYLGYEAHKTFTITKETLVLDENGAVTTMDNLLARVQNGDRILLDYYCPFADGEAAFVAVHSVEVGGLNGKLPRYLPQNGDVVKLPTMTVYHTASVQSGIVDAEVVSGSLPAGTKVEFVFNYLVNAPTVETKLWAGEYKVYVNAQGNIGIERAEEEVIDGVALVYHAGVSDTVMEKAEKSAVLNAEVENFVVLKSTNADYPVGATLTVPAGTTMMANSAAGVVDFGEGNFYTFKLVDDMPVLTILKLNSNVDKYTYGRHNQIVKLEGDTLYTADAHGAYVYGAASSASDIDGGPCVAYVQFPNEAHKTIDVSGAVVFDKDGTKLDSVQALMDKYAGQKVVLDYHCPAADGVATAVFCRGVESADTYEAYVPKTGDQLEISHALMAFTEKAASRNVQIVSAKVNGGSDLKRITVNAIDPINLPAEDATAVPDGIEAEFVTVSNFPVYKYQAGVYSCTVDQYGNVTVSRPVPAKVDDALLAKIPDTLTIVDETGNNLTTKAALTAAIAADAPMKAEISVKYSETDGVITDCTVVSVDVESPVALWSATGDAKYNFLYAATDIANADGSITPGVYTFYSFEGANIQATAGATTGYTKGLEYKGLVSLYVNGLASTAEQAYTKAEPGGFFVVSKVGLEGVTLRKPAADNGTDFVKRYGFHRELTRNADAVASKWAYNCGTGSVVRLMSTAQAHTNSDACYSAGYCYSATNVNADISVFLNIDTIVVDLRGASPEVKTFTDNDTLKAMFSKGQIVEYVVTVDGSNNARYANVVFILE